MLGLSCQSLLRPTLLLCLIQAYWPLNKVSEMNYFPLGRAGKAGFRKIVAQTQRLQRRQQMHHWRMAGEEVILERDPPSTMPVELLLFGVTMTATVMPVNLTPKTTLFLSYFRFLKCGFYSYSDQRTTWGDKV